MSLAEELKNATDAEAAAIQQKAATDKEARRIAEKKDGLKETERMKREIRHELDAEANGPVVEPEMVSLRERLKQPRAEIRYRIEQCQGIGHRVLLAAQFKAGKTTLGANVARSLLDGDLFLDMYDVTPIEGVLVVLDFEMPQTQLEDWYRDQDIENNDRLIVMAMRGAASSFNIVDPVVRQRWAERLKAAHTTYLMLDCVRPVLDALGLSEHTEAGLFLTAFDALLREAEIPEALVIQHMGHSNERARGDSRLLDWPDVGWSMVRPDEDPSSPRYFKAYGRDVDVPETQLNYDPATRRLALKDAEAGGGSRRDAKVSAALTAICEFVTAAATPPSGKQIQDALNDTASGRTIQVLRQAIRKGVKLRQLIEEPRAGRGGGSQYRTGLENEPQWSKDMKVESL